ncbi:GTA baseplate fiber-binding domain-containing protein, partial [Paracoccus onubensis]
VVGRTLSPLVRARPGVIDRGAPLRLQVKGGQLRSVGVRALLSGANLLAIGDGSPQGWELMQFARAQPLGGDIWEISERLRGQAGTDGVMPREWPEGSLVVLMDGAARQVAMPPSARGQERHWRIGPARRAPDDASHVSLTTTAQGIGLRPYAPCHLRIDGRRIGWIRRTRIDGDDWSGRDVPLGESEEVYLLRLRRGHELLHQCELTVPGYEVPERIWLAAKAGGAFTVEVAQMSARFGAGPFVRRNVDGSE